VGEEVEELEDHPDVGPLGSQQALGQRDEVAARFANTDTPALQVDGPGVDGLEKGQASQHRALARPGRSQDHLHLAAMDADGNAPEHVVVPVSLVESDRLQDVLAGRRRAELTEDGVVEQVPDGTGVAHRAPTPRTRALCELRRRVCDVHTKRRSIHAWKTMKMLTRTR